MSDTASKFEQREDDLPAIKLTIFSTSSSASCWCSSSDYGDFR